MNTYEGGYVRGFYQNSKSWHAKYTQDCNYIDDITIGIYHKEGGSAGEFSVQWEIIGCGVHPKLVMYNASWHLMLRYQDLLECMSNMRGDIQPDAFVDVLVGLGMKNLTQTEKCKWRFTSERQQYKI